jgi:hypothetical protein
MQWDERRNPNCQMQIRLWARARTCPEQTKDSMVTIITIFCLMAAACLFAAERFGASKWLVLLCAMLRSIGL